MSNEAADDERRLYQCAKKYEQIVKQFDELIEMMNKRARPPKRRKLSSRGGGSSNVTAPGSPIQADNNEVFVQTITKFLDTLQPETDASCSKSTTSTE
ncbi:hypothetical protein M5689_015839 [Euphorbia peplus]|nr:hypothetical protein M5689_015839 [Euphorbia peplus]